MPWTSWQCAKWCNSMVIALHRVSASGRRDRAPAETHTHRALHQTGADVEATVWSNTQRAFQRDTDCNAQHFRLRFVSTCFGARAGNSGSLQRHSTASTRSGPPLLCPVALYEKALSNRDGLFGMVHCAWQGIFLFHSELGRNASSEL